MASAASGRFLIRLDGGLHAALREAARAAGVSLNDYCTGKLSSPGAGLPEASAVVRRAASIAGAQLAGVVAFGSWARGEATADSDMDVLVVVDGALAVTRELYHRWDAAPRLLWERRVVEPHFVRLPEPDARISGLWAEVAIDGIVVFERGFELSQRLSSIRSRIAAGEVKCRWAKGHRYWVAA
jgi:predicted nucleotidyltransferase